MIHPKIGGIIGEFSIGYDSIRPHEDHICEIRNIGIFSVDGRRIVEHAALMGPILNHMLIDLGEAHPSIGDVRSIGLFGILELVKDRKTKEPLTPWNSSCPEMIALRKFCLDHGLFLYTHWHTVLIIPPLIITEEQLTEGFSKSEQEIDTVKK